jgi:hypothetical protein
VLTDRDMFETIARYVIELTIDGIACGLDPESGKTVIFPHSHVPELNQLLLQFLTLVTNAELDRNPTVKEEIDASDPNTGEPGMCTYPVHRAADILFCKANVVPVGKDSNSQYGCFSKNTTLAVEGMKPTCSKNQRIALKFVYFSWRFSFCSIAKTGFLCPGCIMFKIGGSK